MQPFDDVFDALLFDNDGTLISSLDSVYRCWSAWAVEYGLSADDFARVELHGRTAAEIAADLLPAERVAEAVARIEALEVADVQGGIVALPGSVELLSGLSTTGWAVVTSATRRLAEARLAEVGIRPPTVIAADDVTRGKPDPEPFLIAARRLGADPARCVVFEDAPAGLAAGRAAGMRTVALTTTHAAAELTADAVLPDLSALRISTVAGGFRLRLG